MIDSGEVVARSPRMPMTSTGRMRPVYAMCLPAGQITCTLAKMSGT
jgi:hypothetical protein